MTTTRRDADSQPGMPAPPPPADAPPDRPDLTGSGQPARSDGGSGTTSGIGQLARIVGTVVAPTTLLTSVLFYFGWGHAYNFFDYFGVNSTVLGLTTQDYLMRSLDGLFVPMTVVACAGLLMLWGHGLVRARLATGAPPKILRSLVSGMAIVGLGLAVGGLWTVFVVEPTLLDPYLYGTASPICLTLGVLLLTYAVHLWRSLSTGDTTRGQARPAWAAVAEWGGVFVLVGLSLFWAAGNYAIAVGTGRASEQVAGLARQSSTVVYSHQSLSLSAPGVREVRCRDPEAFYRFRYEGLKLILHSGDQYVFLPAAWSRTNGVAIVLPRSDSLRLEFFPASVVAAPRSSC
jgi:hypothetical protein